MRIEEARWKALRVLPSIREIVRDYTSIRSAFINKANILRYSNQVKVQDRLDRIERGLLRFKRVLEEYKRRCSFF